MRNFIWFVYIHFIYTISYCVTFKMAQGLRCRLYMPRHKIQAATDRFFFISTHSLCVIPWELLVFKLYRKKKNRNHPKIIKSIQSWIWCHYKLFYRLGWYNDNKIVPRIFMIFRKNSVFHWKYSNIYWRKSRNANYRYIKIS